jgi:hypothetical protein
MCTTYPHFTLAKVYILSMPYYYSLRENGYRFLMCKYDDRHIVGTDKSKFYFYIMMHALGELVFGFML